MKVAQGPKPKLSAHKMGAQKWPVWFRRIKIGLVHVRTFDIDPWTN